MENKIKKGRLKILKFEGNETFYVQFKNGEVPLHSKLIDNLGYTKLEQIENQIFTWEISIWNHMAKKTEDKFRITKLIR